MEKLGETFKKHTFKHFLWYYLFYRYVVKMKDPSDYTGLEFSIATQIEQSQIDWFPDNGGQDEEGAMEQLVSDLEGKMGKMGDDVGAFLQNYSGVVSANTSKVTKLTEDFKLRVAAEGQMNEPAPLEF